MSIKRKVSAAIFKYNMIEKGESVAIAFSGGKDSVFLADILKERKDISEIFPIHIDNGFGEDIDGIEKYLRLNFKRYHIEKIEIEKEFNNKKETICYFCTWKRRKRIFEIAYQNGFKKVAYGHNREDAAVTFLMNILFHGEVSALSPNQEFFGGLLRIIRPVYFVSEKEIEYYLRRKNLIVFENLCPYKDKTKRAEIKRLIQSFPDGMNNVYKAIFNIKKEYIP